MPAAIDPANANALTSINDKRLYIGEPLV